MDDNAPKENPPADFNKLDLTQLQGFSFGTQWTQEKPSAPGRREDGGDRRREGPGGGAPSRDRRSFRRPAGPGGDTGGGGAPVNREGGGGGGGERREFSGDRGPRRDGPGGPGGGPGGPGGAYRGGPRREGGYGGGGQGGGGDRGGPRFGGGGQGGFQGRGQQQDRGPYESPYYTATFYPEDTSFNTLVQTIRKSCRTVELFEIARTVVAKNDRFVVVLAHRPSGDAGPRPAPGADAAGGAPKAPKPLFYISVPDGLPFESDETAVAHVLSRHLDKFFDTAEVEVDPPKGNFQVINKCGITGELLGPPNYHRYNQILQQHYAAKVASRMSLEAFRSRVETVRDPEVVNQWLAKMKKTTRYTWKLDGAKPATAAAAPDAAPTPAAETPAEGAAAPAEGAAPVEATAQAPAAPALSTVPTFDSLEDARLHLLTNAREKVVRSTENARFHGKMLDTLPPGEIRRAVEGALERQRRFPLDTANALRGRLRREHFTIFKKGSKGVSYVCAVKRKFRVPGQTFSDSIGALISYIEAHPMVRASELQAKFLGIAPVIAPAAAAPSPTAPTVAPAEGGEDAAPAAAAAAAEAPKPEVKLSIDERAKISRMQGDLVWLVREGYVTEFIDGRLFAPPAVVEARKKEIEAEEHDPENFPDVPPTLAAEAQAPARETDAAPSEQTTEAEPQSSSEAAPAASEPQSEAAAPEAPAPAVETESPAPAAEEKKPE
ncbi:MAG: hypothetical protein V4773_15695 [Verrucomicrobiota bacterium]